jgi:hypothetical protein
VRQTDKREAILLVLQAVVPRPEERLLCYLLVHFVAPAPAGLTLTLLSRLTLQVQLRLDGAAVSFNT